MNTPDLFYIVYLILALGLGAPLLGNYLNRVFEGLRHPLSWAAPLEFGLYRLLGVRAEESMDWKRYGLAVGLFSVFSFAFLYLILALQHLLPFNPQNFAGLSWDLALNTAVSFVTNTNWQAYSGEASLSYFSQAVGLTVQNFASAAVGMAVALAVIRGLRSRNGTKANALTANDRKPSGGLGNFWVDLTRAVLYVLLPLSLILALALVGQGVVQNLSPYTPMTSLEGTADVIPQGPAASQIAVKQLGSNGGGFFGVNSAHPFENPTGLSNFLEILAILLIPMAFPFLYGRMVGRKKEGLTLFAAMTLLFAAGLGLSLVSELNWGTMEGKEMRFGTASSVLWSVATTATSNGSVNAMHDSLSPLSGMVAIVNIVLGEVVFGGVGSGLYGMLAFVVLAVFISGLMVGRSPEYLGKKIEAREVQLSMLAVILPSFVVLSFTALSVLLPQALASRTAGGAHGLSEILYAFSSAAGNNGSAFGGLAANNPYYNLLLTLAMIIGRFGVIVPLLALAGGMAGKRVMPQSSGTFPTASLLFTLLLVFTILILGGLTFFPALTLGPILDHFLLAGGY